MIKVVNAVIKKTFILLTVKKAVKEHRQIDSVRNSPHI